MYNIKQVWIYFTTTRIQDYNHYTYFEKGEDTPVILGEKEKCNIHRQRGSKEQSARWHSYTSPSYYYWSVFRNILFFAIVNIAVRRRSNIHRHLIFPRGTERPSEASGVQRVGLWDKMSQCQCFYYRVECRFILRLWINGIKRYIEEKTTTAICTALTSYELWKNKTTRACAFWRWRWTRSPNRTVTTDCYYFIPRCLTTLDESMSNVLFVYIVIWTDILFNFSATHRWHVYLLTCVTQRTNTTSLSTPNVVEMIFGERITPKTC